MTDIVELRPHKNGGAVFGLHCEYLSTLSDHANSALEWIVENRTAEIEIGGMADDGYVYLTITSQRDAALFKTFWL